MDNIKSNSYFAKRILKSVETLTRYIEDKSIDDLLNDGFLCDAIENRFTKIAEDASNLTNDFKKSTPEIPWNAIVTIRNKVCHNYDVVDAPTLYRTIKFDFSTFRNNLLKTMTVHYMNLQPNPFERIKKKTKNVEMRLFDEKRQTLETGNLIVFTNLATKQEIIVEVVDLKRFASFEQLYAHYKKTELGYNNDEIANPSDMLAYYSKDKIDKYGVLAIEIKLL